MTLLAFWSIFQLRQQTTRRSFGREHPAAYSLEAGAFNRGERVRESRGRRRRGCKQKVCYSPRQTRLLAAFTGRGKSDDDGPQRRLFSDLLI